MAVYMVTIGLVAFSSLFYDFLNLDGEKINSNYTLRNTLKIQTVLFTLFVLIFVAGFREGVGADYWNYARLYDVYIADVWNSIVSFDEPGIRLLAYFSSLIRDHYGSMMMVSAIVTIGLSVFTIVKSSNLFFLSMLLYIFIGDWHGSFNGVRQYIASAILFYGHKYVLSRSFGKYFLCVLIASTFHISALPMIAVYFIPQKKLKASQIVLLFSVAIIGLFSYDIIFGAISSIFTMFRGREFVVFDFVTEQLNIFRLLVAFAPLALYFLAAKTEFLNQQDFFYINMLFINFVIFFISANSAYIARYTIYTNIFTVVAFPRLLKGMDRHLKTLFIMVILALYFVFWYTEVSISPTLNNFSWVF